MRVLRRSKNVTLSVHAPGAGLVERSVSISKILSTIAISLQQPCKPISQPAPRPPSCSPAPLLLSEPLSRRLADLRAEGGLVPVNHQVLARPLFEPIRTTMQTTYRFLIIHPRKVTPSWPFKTTSSGAAISLTNS